MKPLKPWLSIEDQLTLLQQRGMEVERRDVALQYLSRLGYYRLSGYWYPLREFDRQAMAIQNVPVRSDAFNPGSRFEDVVALYVFDKKLRLLALDALERIEMAVRVDVVHLLGERHPIAHETPSCLHGSFSKRTITYGKDKGKTLHQVWMAKYQDLLRRARNEPFVVHHQQNYGVLPIWVAAEVWDFGLLSRLFTGMRFEDQLKIATRYGAQSGRDFALWLKSLNFIRNVSAHHSRLWNVNVLELSPIPPDWSPKLINSRPFLYFCLMQQFLKVICPNSEWHQRFKNLVTQEFPHPTNEAFGIADFGVVDGWEEWKLWSKK